MSHLLEANLPIFIQCLRSPAGWERAYKPAAPTDQTPADSLLELILRPPIQGMLAFRDLPGTATTFDPWDKRREFFQLKRGDTNGLLSFLQTVGLFIPAGWDVSGVPIECVYMQGTDGSYYQEYHPKEFSEKSIWELRRLMQESLSKLNQHDGTLTDFKVRIVITNGRPRMLLTTITFMEALLLTLAIDRIRKAKVRKCARPDCSVLFSNATARKQKYCSWYCGHLQAVRRQRKRQRRTMQISSKEK